MAYLTGFFLVFAGMLIGYFLWYRDLSEDERALSALENEADDLRRGLVLALQANRETEERYLRQRGQLSVIQQLFEDLSANREQSERERAQLVVELDDKRKKYDDSAAEVQRLKQVQIDLEDRIHEITRKNIENSNQLEQSWQNKHLAIELNVGQLKTELKQSEKENDRLSKSLQQLESRNAELKSEIAINKSVLETATRNVSGLKQEYVSLETSLKENHDQLKRARGEAAAANSEKKMVQGTLADMQMQYQELKAESERIRQRLGSVDAINSELASAKQALISYQQQLDLVSQQRDQALQSEKSTLTTAAGLHTRLNNQESTIHKLRELHREAMEKLKYELQVRNELEKTYEEHCKSLEDRFKQQQKQIESQSHESSLKVVQQNEQLKRQVAQQAIELKTVAQKRDAIYNELTQVKQRFSKSQADLMQLEKTTRTINHEAAKLKAETLRMAALEKTIDELKARLQRESAQAEIAKKNVQEPEATVLLFNQAMEVRKRSSYDAEYGGSIEHHPMRGVIYTEEPSRRDDLKLISGVAEVLEGKLNDQGIYTFRQIMEWTPQAVEEFGRLLRFKDRISRDDWQGQAKKLYQQQVQRRNRDQRAA